MTRIMTGMPRVDNCDTCFGVVLVVVVVVWTRVVARAWMDDPDIVEKTWNDEDPPPGTTPPLRSSHCRYHPHGRKWVE